MAEWIKVEPSQHDRVNGVEQELLRTQDVARVRVMASGSVHVRTAGMYDWSVVHDSSKESILEYAAVAQALELGDSA